ncbi:NADP-dependent oxidoreductase domain-containing protein [Gorgonomyces haynaldii]|nr:NADP-dependent oxidoreductase domain-containing protein [Gorgonomyces haynaldii]
MQIAFGTGTIHFKRAGAEEPPIHQELVETIKYAVEAGFRHLDTAEVYNTEREVGLAIKESGIKRSELYVTTKIKAGRSDPLVALRESLEKLQLEYVDLYLVHAPFGNPDLVKTWREMEQCVELGLARQIGVSNFRIQDFEAIKPWKIKPFVNQIEFHPYLQSRDLQAYQQKEGILLESYSQFANLVYHKGGPVDQVVEALAAKYQTSTNQILLGWVKGLGHYSVTTSAKRERIQDLIRPIPKLSQEDVELINKTGEQVHYRRFWQKEFAE